MFPSLDPVISQPLGHHFFSNATNPTLGNVIVLEQWAAQQATGRISLFSRRMITHRKTRTGCVQCKKRRIKCDETKPQCEKCRRTQRECSFQNPQSDLPVQASENFTMKEMELLHHFVTHTAKTLADQTEHQRIWQTDVVQMAFQHRFLMHGIIAVAAIHVSVLRESEADDLSILAANHQDLGLQGFRSALENFSPENSHALFAFSMLVVCYVIASSGTRINPSQTTASFLNDVLLSAIVDWVRLLRGADHIARRGRRYLEEGPLAGLLIRESLCRVTEPADEKARIEDQWLVNLQQLWLPGTPSSIDGIASEEALLYEEALHLLREAFGRMSRANISANVCTWCYDRNTTVDGPHANIARTLAGLIWFMQMPDEFFEMLEQRKPVALVLVAHQGILVKRMTAAWWNRTPSIKLASSVHATLPQEYHSWIEWPCREIGHVPEG